MERLLNTTCRLTNRQSSLSIDVRRVLVKRFPYSIVFINHDEDLWVVAFAISIGDQVIGENG
jgi:hypothetical protein